MALKSLVKKAIKVVFSLAIVITLFLSPASLFALDNQKENKIPLPTGLSKDTQFVIYYIDKRFSEMDKRLSLIQREIDKRFELVDKRFEQVDKRFEQVDKHFEQVDKRFDQVDKRFEQVDKRFEQVDKRFDQVNERFDQVDNRFDDVGQRFNQLTTFLWILAGIFTTITATVIGFAYWDRRTIIRQAREEAIERIEKEGRLQDFIRALRAFARKNQEFAEILRSFNLL